MSMNFSKALEALKIGARVCRSGWNGKGMFIYLVQGSTFLVNRPPLLGIMGQGTRVNYLPHIDMKTVDGSCVPWLASQSDLLSDDWEIIGLAARAESIPTDPTNAWANDGDTLDEPDAACEPEGASEPEAAA